VAKFGDDRPSGLGDYVAKKRKRRSKHQQQNGMACPYYSMGGHN